MKPASIPSALGPAAALGLLSSYPGCWASPSHAKLHQGAMRPVHFHGHAHSAGHAVKRDARCVLPEHPDIVRIPGAMNGGWAMSPDQECRPGHYCPIACKSGMVMAQWDPKSDYTFPSSMNGGLFCDGDGIVHKPFPDKPYCVDGTGAVQVLNKCVHALSWCQTVLPGNELMAIPTMCHDDAVTTIAVPDSSYWRNTSAHFYINPPGIGREGCIWGSKAQPVGNWSPYVAGANTVASGETFVTIGWNPKFVELKMPGPDFSVQVQCPPDAACVGLPCEIRRSSGVNSISCATASVGAGGARFGVVTVPKDKKATIVLFHDADGTDAAGDQRVHVDKASNAVHYASSAVVEMAGFEPQTTKTTETTRTTATEQQPPPPQVETMPPSMPAVGQLKVESLAPALGPPENETTAPEPPKAGPTPAPEPPETTSAVVSMPAYTPVPPSTETAFTAVGSQEATQPNCINSSTTTSSKYRRPTTTVVGALFLGNETAPTAFAGTGSTGTGTGTGTGSVLSGSASSGSASSGSASSGSASSGSAFPDSVWLPASTPLPASHPTPSSPPRVLAAAAPLEGSAAHRRQGNAAVAGLVVAAIAAACCL